MSWGKHATAADVGLYLNDEQRVQRYGRPRPEYRFAEPYRLWRLDYAYPLLGLAIEVDGGTFTHTEGQGAQHINGVGYADNCRKLAVAGMLGWLVIRVTTDMLDRGEAWVLIDEALALRRAMGVLAAEPQPISAHMAAVILKLGKPPARKRPSKKASTAAYASA